MLPQSSIHVLLFICTVKQCRRESHPRCLYAYLKRFGLKSHGLLGKHLSQSLINIENTQKTQDLYNMLDHNNNNFSFDSLIHGYVKFGNPKKALDLYKRSYIWERMQNDVCYVHPSGRTMVSLLKACGKLNDIKSAFILHQDIVRMEHLRENVFVGSAVIAMYAKCGMLDTCEEVFDSMMMLRQDVVSWTTMIDAYVRNGMPFKSFELLQQMKVEGVFPNEVTFVCNLKACSIVGNVEKGKYFHVDVESNGFVYTNLNVGNALVNMYCDCGMVSMGEQVFEALPVRDVISWTTLISVYSSKTSSAEKALRCLDQMQFEGISPDAVTIVFGLKACGNIGAREKGQKIHAEIGRKSILERDVHVGTALFEMYFKFGMLTRAQEVFDKLYVRDVVAWNHLIVGYNNHGLDEEAFNCFEQMQVEGVSPDSVSYNFSLKACGNLGDLGKGREIHVEVERKEFLTRDCVIGTALVEMYGKCGQYMESEELFNQLQNRDVVSWNSLITVHLNYDCGEDALTYFERMQLDDVSPNVVTFLCALKACTNVGAIDKGQNLHAEIERRGLLQIDIVGNALLNMYAQCASFTKAHQMFSKLHIRDVVSWTVMMTGYAKLGKSKEVFHIFDEMLGQGIKPNMITFIIVLNACSRRGLSSASLTYFEAMTKHYGIIPIIEHHGCMIDLLGRLGELEKLAEAIERMPISPNLVLWQTVLTASQKWGKLNFGEWAFEHTLCLDDNYFDAYAKSKRTRVHLSHRMGGFS